MTQYLAVPLDDIEYLVEDYVEYREPDFLDGCDGCYWISTEPPMYGYIANSDMTDITVAFVSSNREKVAGLSNASHIVGLLLGSDDYREESGYEDYDDIIALIKEQGFTILDDENGDLGCLGESALFDKPLNEILEEIILVYGTDDAEEIYAHLMHDYVDRVVDDLYVNLNTNTMIEPVKVSHWRF